MSETRISASDIFKKCARIEDYTTPASAYPNATKGNARIVTNRYRGVYRCYMQDGYELFETDDMRVKNLQLKKGKRWRTVMVDDPPHWWAMQSYAARCHGRALVAGLGLGLIVHALVETMTKSDRIEKIVVVEKNRDVIELVSPFLPVIISPFQPADDRIEIVEGDYYEYLEESEERYDSVVFDLFVGQLDKDFCAETALREYLRIYDKYGTDVFAVIHGFDVDKIRNTAKSIVVAIEKYPTAEIIQNEMTLILKNREKSERISRNTRK